MNDDEKWVYWWNTAGILISILIFLLSSLSNNYQYKYIEKFIHLTTFVSKNDVINVVGSFQVVRPDIFKQGYLASMYVTGEVNDNTDYNLVDTKLKKINSYIDYQNQVSVYDVIENGKTNSEEYLNKQQVLQNLEALAFIILIFTQIIAARLAFKKFNSSNLGQGTSPPNRGNFEGQNNDRQC